MSKVQEFLDERKKALDSLDEWQIIDWAEKYRVAALLEPHSAGNDDTFWLVVHVMRSQSRWSSPTARNESKRWLDEWRDQKHADKLRRAEQGA